MFSVEAACALGMAETCQAISALSTIKFVFILMSSQHDAPFIPGSVSLAGFSQTFSQSFSQSGSSPRAIVLMTFDSCVYAMLCLCLDIPWCWRFLAGPLLALQPLWWTFHFISDHFRPFDGEICLRSMTVGPSVFVYFLAHKSILAKTHLGKVIAVRKLMNPRALCGIKYTPRCTQLPRLLTNNSW